MADETEIENEYGIGSPPIPAQKPLRILLSSRKTSQRTLTRILQRMADGQLDLTIGRALIYGMSVYLGYLRLEAEKSIEDRLDSLEAMLQEAAKSAS